MVQKAIAAAGVALILATGPGVAQQASLPDGLEKIQVFDCALEGARVLHVFQTAPSGEITLIGSEDTAIRTTETGLMVMFAAGVREISGGDYFIYGGGTAQTGTCSDVTGDALRLFSPLATALMPDPDSENPIEQAAALEVAKAEALQIRARGAAQIATTRAEASEAALAEAKGHLTKAKEDRNRLQALLDHHRAAVETAEARAEDLATQLQDALSKLEAEQQARAEDTDRLTGTAERLQAALSEAETKLRASEEETARLTEVVAEGAALLETAKLDAAETAATLSATQADLTAAEEKLADLTALHQSAAASATEFQGQLGSAQSKLEETEASRRALVATIAGLNGKLSELSAALRKARTERDAALSAPPPTRVVASSGGLTTAAIRRLATLQGRSQHAVRNELCRLIGRSAGC